MSLHIANVVYGLYSGIDLAALSPDAQEVFLLQLETLDNSILFDAISILRQYFGLSIYDISAQDTIGISDTCSQIALPAILIRLLDAVIRRGELSKNEHSQLCQLRSTLCERFVLSFKALDESDPLQTKYCLFFSLALSMLARDYRTGIAGTRDLIRCAGYAQKCINGEKKLNIPKADGYLQVALCLNARMEDLLNATDTKMNDTLPFSPQLADAIREAVRDYHEGSMYKRDEANAPGIIYAIEEPETSQHSENQKKLINALIALSAESNVQVIITTHSAVLVNALDFKNIRLICADGSRKHVEAVRSGQLPFPSLNEVNYLAFSEISEGYHDELYGYLKEQGWLNEYKQGKATVSYKRLNFDGTTLEQQICMTEYIRHQIHHPENKYNARFNDLQLRRSIEDMRAFVTSKAQTPGTT